MSTTRPWVDAFADEMEAKLAENRHKGDREGWARCDPRWLLTQLRREIRELSNAMPKTASVFYLTLTEQAAIRAECADIANFAMMIADVAGGMKPAGPAEP